VKLRAKEMGSRKCVLVESQTVVMVVLVMTAAMMMMMMMIPHLPEFSFVSGDFNRPSPPQQIRVLGARVCHVLVERQCNIVACFG
jgi:hypothetical protein